MKLNMFYKTLVVAGGLAVAAAAHAQISGTKHNLGSSGTGTNTTDGTAEICVFCHTPHAADTTVAAPLWNKDTTQLGGSYTTYSSTTLDGETATVGSVSLACLSCHDGTQAMDNIINAPGSGGYDLTGGGATGLAWDWTGARVDADGKLSSGVALLGTDLSNDHPIGIQYAGGGITSSGGTGADIDFKAPTKSGTGTDSFWWVETGGNTTRNKTDMILYTRSSDDFGGSGTVEPSVECASCHDPHTSNATFLRTSNASSAVCLACHTK